MSQRELFMATIKRMWINIGRSEASWNVVHDWDYYFRLCHGRVDGAVWAFEEALQCE